MDEPLIPDNSLQWFVQSLQEEATQDLQNHLFAGIAELPQANRDTLAYIVLHLQRYFIYLSLLTFLATWLLQWIIETHNHCKLNYMKINKISISFINKKIE